MVGMLMVLGLFRHKNGPWLVGCYPLEDRSRSLVLLSLQSSLCSVGLYPLKDVPTQEYRMVRGTSLVRSIAPGLWVFSDRKMVHGWELLALRRLIMVPGSPEMQAMFGGSLPTQG